MKFKKRLMALVISCLTIVNMFSLPVLAAEEVAKPLATTIEVQAVPNDATYAGTIYRAGGTVNLGRVTLIGSSKLYVYFPKNNNLDLFQGTVTFRSGLTTVTKNVTNLGTDTWIFDESNVGSGIWTVTVSGNAIGTTQKCEVWYKTEF